MPDSILEIITTWAQERDDIRAVLLPSTRAHPNPKLDPFSDYDIILAVTDVQPYFDDRRWLDDFGSVLVVYRDPIRDRCGYDSFVYVTQYEHDRLKIDFTVLDADLLRNLPPDCDLRQELDAGYRVLFDRDGVTENLPEPTYRAYIPEPPTEAEYHETIEVFFHEATYVAKNIWRDELLPAKYSFDQVMKQNLLRVMLEWRIEIDHDWSVKTGVLGKGLKRHIRPELWLQLESTYVGTGAEENWDALFRLIALYRQVAQEVGEALGYEYPHALHRRMMAYLQGVRAMGRQ